MQVPSLKRRGILACKSLMSKHSARCYNRGSMNRLWIVILMFALVAPMAAQRGTAPAVPTPQGQQPQKPERDQTISDRRLYEQALDRNFDVRACRPDGGPERNGPGGPNTPGPAAPEAGKGPDDFRSEAL